LDPIYKVVVYRKGESEAQQKNVFEEEVECGCWEAFRDEEFAQHNGGESEPWVPEVFAYVMHNNHSGYKFTTHDKTNPPLGTLVCYPGEKDGLLPDYQFSLQSHQTTLAPINATLYTFINGSQMLDGGGAYPGDMVAPFAELTLDLSSLFCNWPGMHPKPAVAKYAFQAAKQVAEVLDTGSDDFASEYSAFLANVETTNAHWDQNGRAPPNWFL
jgi:hypothetical protein